jgi:hypothetical protein
MAGWMLAVVHKRTPRRQAEARCLIGLKGIAALGWRAPSRTCGARPGPSAPGHLSSTTSPSSRYGVAMAIHSPRGAAMVLIYRQPRQHAPLCLRGQHSTKPCHAQLHTAVSAIAHAALGTLIRSQPVTPPAPRNDKSPSRRSSPPCPRMLPVRAGYPAPRAGRPDASRFLLR